MIKVEIDALAETSDRRLALLETDVGEIRKGMSSDFRITWAGIIASALGLAALMAKGFG